MSVEIAQDFVGATLRATIREDGSAVDLSAATVKQLKLRKPSGTVVTKTADFTTDGSDGKIEYTTEDGDLDTAGDWQLQPYLELPGWQGHTRNKVGFRVKGNLAA